MSCLTENGSNMEGHISMLDNESSYTYTIKQILTYLFCHNVRKKYIWFLCNILRGDSKLSSICILQYY